MGIQIEFNPDLALRNISEYKKGKRKKEECLPEILKENIVYNFIKKGQRVYWFNNSEEWSYGQIPLLETKGNEKLSRPIASIKIIEATHYLENNEVYTKGKYKVIEIFDPNNPKIHFESFKKINKK